MSPRNKNKEFVVPTHKSYEFGASDEILRLTFKYRTYVKSTRSVKVCQYYINIIKVELKHFYMP